MEIERSVVTLSSASEQNKITNYLIKGNTYYIYYNSFTGEAAYEEYADGTGTYLSWTEKPVGIYITLEYTITENNLDSDTNRKFFEINYLDTVGAVKIILHCQTNCNYFSLKNTSDENSFKLLVEYYDSDFRPLFLPKNCDGVYLGETKSITESVFVPVYCSLFIYLLPLQNNSVENYYVRNCVDYGSIEYTNESSIVDDIEISSIYELCVIKAHIVNNTSVGKTLSFKFSFFYSGNETYGRHYYYKKISYFKDDPYKYFIKIKELVIKSDNQKKMISYTRNCPESGINFKQGDDVFTMRLAADDENSLSDINVKINGRIRKISTMLDGIIIASPSDIRSSSYNISYIYKINGYSLEKIGEADFQTQNFYYIKKKNLYVAYGGYKIWKGSSSYFEYRIYWSKNGMNWQSYTNSYPLTDIMVADNELYFLFQSVRYLNSTRHTVYDVCKLENNTVSVINSESIYDPYDNYTATLEKLGYSGEDYFEYDYQNGRIFSSLNGVSYRFRTNANDTDKRRYIYIYAEKDGKLVNSELYDMKFSNTSQDFRVWAVSPQFSNLV